jgi:hypothetical protein
MPGAVLSILQLPVQGAEEEDGGGGGEEKGRGGGGRARILRASLVAVIFV